MKMRAESSGVALVTTVWLAQSQERSRHVSVVNSFVLYHLRIGVAKILLFLDGPEADHEDEDSGQKQPSVHVLHERVQQAIAQGVVELIYSDKAQSEAGNVPMRQMANASKAMSACVVHNDRLTKAESQELRWLLHLDFDELLYIESFHAEDPAHTLCCKLRECVASLETQQNDQFTLVCAHERPCWQYFGAIPRASGAHFCAMSRGECCTCILADQVFVPAVHKSMENAARCPSND